MAAAQPTAGQIFLTRTSPNCSRGALPSTSRIVIQAAKTNAASCSAVRARTRLTGGSAASTLGSLAATIATTAAPNIAMISTADSSAANGAQIGTSLVGFGGSAGGSVDTGGSQFV